MHFIMIFKNNMLNYYHTGNDLPEEFFLYYIDFEKLCLTTINAINGTKYEYYKDNYLYRLICSMNKISCIDDSDVVQQLYLIWLKAIKNYRISKPNIRIRRYLIRMSVWGIRDWLQAESNIPLSGPRKEPEEEQDYPFTLDLSFLLYGSTYHPLQGLTDYERYLIYLKYVEGKHIFAIADHLQRDRGLVSKQLTTIHNKLRSRFNEDAS